MKTFVQKKSIKLFRVWTGFHKNTDIYNKIFYNINKKILYDLWYTFFIFGCTSDFDPKIHSMCVYIFTHIFLDLILKTK